MAAKKSSLSQIIMACPKCGATGELRCYCGITRKLMTKAKAADLAIIEFARKMGL